MKKNISKNQSKSIFLSHAVADKVFADKVVDLLDTAMGIDVQKMVFCSSLEGIGIPKGKDFKQFIKEQIQEPKIVILLISQNYLTSQFCIAEAGASWAMSHRVIPILIPPVKYDDMKSILAGLQAVKIEDPGDWNEALAVIKEVLGIDPNVNRWERKRDEHVEAIKTLIPKQQLPLIIPLSKFKTIEEKLKHANEEIIDLEKEVDNLKELNVKIKQSKDAKDVARIEFEHMPAKNAFDTLLSKAKNDLRHLPPIAKLALYHYFRKEHLEWSDFGDDDKSRKMKQGIENAYLRNDDPPGIVVNEDDPKVKRALASLSELNKFIDNNPEVAEGYEKEYDHQLLFTSKRFWDMHFP